MFKIELQRQIYWVVRVLLWLGNQYLMNKMKGALFMIIFYDTIKQLEKNWADPADLQLL